MLPARPKTIPLSVAERARLTTGADLWTTHAEPRLGLPSLRMSDGPNGVRGSRFDERVSAWCTPCGTALAATWDVDLVRRVGGLLGDEARRMGVDVLLGPTVNLHRSPLGGRGFECYSEDPLLSGWMAAAWITGVQSRGVAASPKHLVGNDSETNRTTINCVIDERAMRELYLLPFEYAVRAGAWTLMVAYNRVNGTHATEHRSLVTELLKQEWTWDGLAVSDWGAAHDTVGCALAGLDLEMPVGKVFGAALGRAVIEGAVPESVLDDKIDRLRRLASRVRAPGRSVGSQPPSADFGTGSADQRRLLIESAAAAFVLLKNEANLLPLALDSGRLAVVGPNAADPCYQGGGSAWVNTGEIVSPLSVLVERYGGAGRVVHERGCTPRSSFRPLTLAEVQSTGAEPSEGLTVDYLSGHGAAAAVASEVRRSSFLSWFDGLPALPAGVEGEVRMSAWWTPQRSGDYEMAVRGSGATTLLVDGVEIASLTAQAEEADVYGALFSEDRGQGTVRLTAHQTVLLEARMRHVPIGIPVLEVGHRPPQPADLLERAVRAAEGASSVVLMVGTSEDVEAESLDRTTTTLPGEQDALVEAVLEANPRTVVVVNAGSAVAMPWIAKASTVLYAWFAGHGFADALGDVLSGVLEPGGRLPITLAASPDQYSAYGTRPDPDRQLVYAESVFVGYRHLDRHQLEPAFPFGHGLGYTDFSYDSVQASGAVRSESDTAMVKVVLSNVGRRAGKEVVQLYVSPVEGAVDRPPLELKAFAAVELAAGESRAVTFRLDSRAFAHWDPVEHRWHVSAGSFGVHVGRSSRDLRCSTTVEAGEHLL